MNKLDKQYTDLLQDILDNGVTKSDRTGTGTISVFGRQIRHNMKDGFPLLTTKKMPFKTITTELLWFLRGDTNIKFLVDNNCHIWDGDAYQSYCKRYWELGEIAKIEYGSSHYNHETNEYEFETYSKEEFVNYIKTNDAFAKKWGDLGPIYGAQWRAWGGYDKIPSGYNHGSITHFKEVPKHDQIANLINDLKTNPDSRRLMVTAWNPAELDSMVLPPCHYGFQVYTRELKPRERLRISTNYGNIHDIGANWDVSHKLIDNMCDKWGVPKRAISLMWNQRSVDTFLGLPFNIASYGLLLEIIAKAVNMVPDQLIGNLGDVHLYSNHIEQAKEQIGMELSNEERYNIWFTNNYETGMERFFDPNNLPDFEDSYYEPTPKRTREPYPLPTLNINTEFWPTESGECGEGPIDAQAVFNNFTDEYFCKCLLEEDIQLFNYQSHLTIKAPLSN
jgi:thymidylate synthase